MDREPLFVPLRWTPEREAEARAEAESYLARLKANPKHAIARKERQERLDRIFANRAPAWYRKDHARRLAEVR